MTIHGQTGVSDGVVKEDEVDHNATLVFFNCKDCTYTVEAYCIKLYVQGCENLTLVLNGKIITATIETFKCTELTLQCNTAVGTLQVCVVPRGFAAHRTDPRRLQADLCNGLRAVFREKALLKMLVWAGCDALSVRCEDDAEATLAVGYEAELARDPDLNRERSQFRISFVDGKLIQERLIRLPNGFATTEREKAVFDQNQELAMQKMATEMGITIGRKKTEKHKPNEQCPCGSGKKVKRCCPHLMG